MLPAIHHMSIINASSITSVPTVNMVGSSMPSSFSTGYISSQKHNTKTLSIWLRTMRLAAIDCSAASVFSSGAAASYVRKIWNTSIESTYSQPSSPQSSICSSVGLPLSPSIMGLRFSFTSMR